MILPGNRIKNAVSRRHPSASAITGTLAPDSPGKVVDFHATRLGSPISFNSQGDLFAASSKERKTTVMVAVTAVPSGSTKIGTLHATPADPLLPHAHSKFQPDFVSRHGFRACKNTEPAAFVSGHDLGRAIKGGAQRLPWFGRTHVPVRARCATEPQARL